MAQTSTRLLVLGVVRETGPVHGYDLRRELLSWGAEEWANVTPGSVYNALKTLVREGMLEVVGTDRQGARPERTTYRLTDEGEEDLRRRLRENPWQSGLPNHPLLAGLAFLPLFPRDELANQDLEGVFLPGLEDDLPRSHRPIGPGLGELDRGYPQRA
jgi:DNA-binding PadR family transcriptional regulator